MKPCVGGPQIEDESLILDGCNQENVQIIVFKLISARVLAQNWIVLEMTLKSTARVTGLQVLLKYMYYRDDHKPTKRHNFLHRHGVSV